MNWAGTSDFFAMGGYGLYVWGSYAMAALLMVGEAVAVRRRHRQALRSIDAENAQEH
jgi:heme exporter protein D